jgi:UDP-N-acetylglucosamine 2-epimerase (non-hydrolysing)
MLKIAVILGTRPEVIKLAPVIREAQARKHRVQLITTGQHRDLVVPLLEFFGLKSDLELAVMARNQGLAVTTEKILGGLNLHRDFFEDSDLIFVQGDTVTAWAGACWGFCHQIRVAHIEAGLRTNDLAAPFPEEGYRQMIGRIASFHFAPTLQCAMALEREWVSKKSIHVVGNTSIDALNWALLQVGDRRLSEVCELPSQLADFIESGKFVLVTAHRRESLGLGMEGICKGLLGLLSQAPEVRVVFPMHPNPQVRESVQRNLGNHDRIHLCESLPYAAFISVLKRAEVILTDSGGIQEEAPTLRKPILVLRDQTERQEGVDAGFSKLIGTDPAKIIEATLSALRVGLSTQAENPFGDGKAAMRVFRAVEEASEIFN